MNLSEVQISGEALRHNLAALKSLVPAGRKVSAVVKGNAYGHGLAEVVKAIDGQVDYFQIDDIEELRALRKVTATPALLLGYVPRASVAEAIALDAEITIYDTERLPDLAGARVHLKVDALLGRQGILPEDVREFADCLLKHPDITLAGIYGHFANIEDTTDLSHAHLQQEQFDKAYAAIEAAGWKGLPRHLSSTSGLMTMESAGANDLVRIGIGLYGLYPSGPLARSHQHLDLRPVMRWVSHLAQVKTIPARHPVGYGLTFITPREMRIGIVPQGYADGYDRGLSSSGEVLVGGKRCAVLGRIAMNMFTIDLSEVHDARPENEVVLLGGQGHDRITAEEIASRIGTINYEVVARVASLLPRLAV